MQCSSLQGFVVLNRVVQGIKLLTGQFRAVQYRALKKSEVLQ